MAWAVYEPSTFGASFPSGEYVGWKEGLQEYYETEMSDAEKRALGMEERLNTYSISKKFTEDCGALKDVECVKEFKLKKTPKNLASLIMIVNGLLLVNEALKSLIEDLEPDTHQFWPIKITIPRDRAYPDKYYGLRIGQFLDSFQPDQSDPGSFDKVNKYFGKGDTKKITGGLALSTDVISSAHLWRESNLKRPNVFISDMLHAKIVEQGLRLPTHHPVMEV